MHCFQGKRFCFPLGTRTYIMGILNVTPDSFLDGGKWNNPQVAIAHAKEMEEDGADFLDIGAQSTRPGHTPLSAAEELEILQQFLPKIARSVQIPISVDTFFPEVAAYALQNGAAIVNDVSGAFSAEMASVVRAHDAGWIVMHSGNGNADSVAEYPQGVVAAVRDFFAEMQQACAAAGIAPERICYDIGIGFGKSHADNLELLRRISELKKPQHALLTAVSCKRVVGLETQTDGDERKYGTIAANSIAIAGGTDILRVHHVREAKSAAKMTDALVRRGVGNHG